MLEFIKQPWHWSVSGLLIGLLVPTLLILGNRIFGVSVSLRHICAAILPAKISFFQYDWKKERWNLVFVGGVLLGGFIGGVLLRNPNDMVIAEATQTALATYGISNFSQLMPLEIFNWNELLGKGLFFIVLGGFLVGFGTRYAGGCTSGHSITGLSKLQGPSLVATICFFIGGLIMTHLLFPFIL